jgi:REP element-mobilizing transposase RayT
MSKPPPTLVPGGYYHIYNRGNNRENIFREARNYEYFLRLYAKHIFPVADTFAYCLLKNHFHFLVRIKDEKDFPKDLTGLEDLSGLVSKRFSNFFNAYARSFNRRYGRTGALFQRPFGRVPVTTNAHFVRLVTYIHQNPQKHGFVKDFREWPYSSFHAHLAEEATRLKRDEVLEWFGGGRRFAQAHQLTVAEKEVEALVPDDFD